MLLSVKGLHHATLLYATVYFTCNNAIGVNTRRINFAPLHL